DAPRWPPGHVARLALPLRTTLAGEVEDIRHAAPPRATILLRAFAIMVDAAWRPVNGRVRLTVRGGLPKLRAGDGLRVDTTLRAPRSFANPGSLDLVGHLARRGIWVTAGVWDARRGGRLPPRHRGRAVTPALS